MGTKTKNDLIRDFQEGCSRAFTAVYDDLAPLLYLYAVKLTQDKAMAEEVVQDSFVALFHRRAQMDLQKGLEAIKSYMIVAVRHGCFRALHKHDAQQARIREMVTFLPISQDPEVFRQEVVSAVFAPMKKKIRELPKTQQQVFELFFLQDRTIEEVAARLGLNIRSVNNAKYQILRALRTNEFNLTTIITLMILINPDLVLLP